jgi:hypothetical protein
MTDNVTALRRSDLAVLVQRLKDVLYSKPGQPPVNFVEALGALEMVKIELVQEMLNGDGE